MGDYLLLKRIGEGGMAEVYLAQYSGADHSVGPQSQVVVKRIKPELFSKPDYPVFREMFLNEAKLVRELSHSNLARIYALNEAVDSEVGAKVPFIVGEYVQGSQLWELMRIATRGFTGVGVPAGIASFVLPPEFEDVAAAFSVWKHMEDFSQGIVDTRYLVYDATLSGLALFGSIRALANRRLA